MGLPGTSFPKLVRLSVHLNKHSIGNDMHGEISEAQWSEGRII